jgi:hypothetical protein
MIKKLLLTSAAAVASITAMQAQNASLSPASFSGRTYSTANNNSLTRHINATATANCVDTCYYIELKKQVSTASLFLVTNSTGLNKFAGGFSYANTGTITVTKLGIIAGRKAGSPSATVPTKVYLYNVNASGAPISKIDSTTINVGAAGYYYGNLSTPRTVTTNFAVVYRNGSTVNTDTIQMYLSPANTSTAATNNYGERRGYVATLGSATSFTAVNTYFGSTYDIEPMAWPVYNYNMTANYTSTPASPICINTNVVNTNTSSNTAVAENYMFNLSRFCKKWNVAFAGLDSVYTWNFSDGSGRFTNMNQNHTYTLTGTFNDSLITTCIPMSISPDCIDKKVTPITVVAQPTVMVSPASSTVCTGATATLTASGATTYAWQGGQSAASATYAPSSNSTYSVTGTNACGTATASANVAVTAVAIINAASSSTAICAGQSSTLTVNGATTYTWAPSATLSSANGGSVVATPAATTIYTITGVSSCGTATTTVTQNVTAAPSVSVSASTTSVCSGGAATFTASGATTYSWMPTGTTNSTLTVNPTTSTTYTVMGTTAGCAGTKTVALAVTPNPTISVSSSSMTVCSGSSATLTATGNGTGYLWNTGAFTPVIVVTPTTTPTTYSVGTANGSCIGTASISISVITCTTTGIDELSGFSINVYPNPNTGVLNIAMSSDLANHASVQIFDALGKLVISQNLSSEQNMVNTSALSNGVYIFKVMSADKSLKIGRMIKQ